MDYVEGYLFPAYQSLLQASKSLLAVQQKIGLEIDGIGPDQVLRWCLAFGKKAAWRDVLSVTASISPEAGKRLLPDGFVRWGRIYFRTRVTGFVLEGGRVAEIKTDGQVSARDW